MRDPGKVASKGLMKDERGTISATPADPGGGGSRPQGPAGSSPLREAARGPGAEGFGCLDSEQAARRGLPQGAPPRSTPPPRRGAATESGPGARPHRTPATSRR